MIDVMLKLLRKPSPAAFLRWSRIESGAVTVKIRGGHIWFKRDMSRTGVSGGQSVASREVTDSSLPNYKETIQKLNSLQSNAEVIERSRKRPAIESALHNFSKTIKYLARVGISLEDLDKLNVIHVSGTKGKGSTCAFCECILRKHGLKTGFYSSPHMVAVRERISINGKPLSESVFTSYFWEVYNQLHEAAETPDDLPPYFKFLTVMAFHVFLKEKVDVAIVEVGIGGQYDCTNTIRTPIVCGITSLGLDHTALLGSTLDKIAWQKAGIFKTGVPAVTVPQKETAVKVMVERAAKIGVPLLVAPTLTSHQWNGQAISLGLHGAVQQENAALALQLTATWLQRKMSPGVRLFPDAVLGEPLPVAPTYNITKEIAEGLRDCYWPGRHQILHRGKLVWYLDGAHTVESMQYCAKWFQQASHKQMVSSGDKTFRILLFNSTGDRTPESLLTSLLFCKFDLAIFCPNTVYLEKCASSDQLAVAVSTEQSRNRCLKNQKAWMELSAQAADKRQSASHFECIADVIAFLQSAVNHSVTSSTELSNTDFSGDLSSSVLAQLKDCTSVHVLATGSLHLVGGVLSVVDPNLESREVASSPGAVDSL